MATKYALLDRNKNMNKVTLSSVKDVIPDIGGNFQLDPNVIAKFPEGTKVLRASSYGTSLWTRTARITTVLPDGEKKDYFLKCATEGGAVMMEGEFNSITTIYNLMPSFVPKPLAWGKFQLASPDTYFFLCDFVEMSTDMPDPVKFCARVAELHRKGVSPTGKFGFHITTVHGKTEQPVEWDDNWTRYFTRLISHFFARDLLSNGRWPEYETAFKRLVQHVIPQVLDPLNSEGRNIRPSLVHGDLWEGNSTTDLVSGEPMVFDAAVMYAHNEYELGMWRREIIRFGKPYFKQYLRNIPPSEPVEQWDDRNALYSLKFKLSYCLHRPGLPLVREAILADIMQLVDKYPPKTSIETDLGSTGSNEDGKLPSVTATGKQVPTDELAQLKASETVVNNSEF